MKLPRTVLLVALFAATPVVAQQLSVGIAAPATNSAALRYDASRTSLLTENPQLSREDVIVGKKFQASGPLVRPFKAIKAKKFWNAPLSLLRAINPFAPAESKEEIKRVGDLSPRAWTTIAGWHPGASAFADPITHEPELNLVSLSRRSQP